MELGLKIDGRLTLASLQVLSGISAFWPLANRTRLYIYDGMLIYLDYITLSLIKQRAVHNMRV